jgi:photosystem II stability/assembly factor-like uncharacterized protein
MKRCSIATLLLLYMCGLYSQGNWNKVDFPSHHFLRSVFFTDSLYGWVAGDSGTIYHTPDGGLSWIKQTSHTNNEIVDIFFLDRNEGWASSYNYTVPPFGTVLLHTMDGGNNWIPSLYPVPDVFITCIFFFDQQNGWMGGRPHTLVKTTDGGLNWVQASVDTSTLAFFPVLGIHFYNRQYGYACGGRFDIAGVIWSTNDGGNRWRAIDPSYAPADEVHGLHTFDSITVMGAGGDPDFGYGIGMIRTQNGGSTWSYDELGMQGYAMDLDFRNASEAWAPVASRPAFIYSLDAGTTWTEIPSPDSSLINDVIFPDTVHGYAVGRNGAVLKYKPKLVGGIDLHELPNRKAELSQNYPNPFYESTIIAFHVTASEQAKYSSCSLIICNIYGEEVAVIPVANTDEGSGEVRFSAANLPGGIYFYHLMSHEKGHSQVVTLPRKMVLMK